MKTDMNQPIIKKVRKKKPSEAHGGAWKLAYADFMTSMMAFFLLMWLINATSAKQKKGISSYFSPLGISEQSSGNGKILGGDSITSEKILQEDKSSPVFVTMVPKNHEKKHEKTATPSKEKLEDKKPDAHKEDLQDSKNFKMAEDAIYKKIESSPTLKKFAKNILIQETPKGLKVMIVDADHRSMFPIGDSKMYDYTINLLRAVTTVIKSLPNKITITGHTDATPYTNKKGYDNWDLSTARANETRRILISSGLPSDQIKEIIGKAATDPLIKNDPNSPQNRRISILLLKKD